MSNFIVSARKYRPQRFDEVVGQQHVSQTLKNAIQSDHLAHAFLFCGPRGVGKTTCARILAKTLNCQNPTDDFEPCNSCNNCTSFSQNASFNITELDAASNNSVEHIRALIEQVRFQPQQGQYKVFIIDEVHMLSQAAFNAFLKTLEEPPSYAIFILATTEKHKIIPTILSRCQIFDFKRIQGPDIVAHLSKISEQEGIKAEPDALHIIAQKADGALRDALSIFDRIVSFSGKTISYEDVISNLNVLDYDYYFRVVEALLAEDMSETLTIFDDILRKGFDADLFINGLAEHCRNLLVCQDAQTLQLLDVGDKLHKRYQQQAVLSPITFLLSCLNLANDCDINFKLARNKRLHVEMTLIKMANIGRAYRITELPTAEKKTPDLTESKSEPETAPSSEEKTPEKPSQSAETVAMVKEDEPTYEAKPAEQATDNSNADSPEMPAEATQPKSETGKHLLASANVSNLMEEIKATAKNNDAPVVLLLEDVKKIWQAYIDKTVSDSVRIQLENTIVEVDGATIRLSVGSDFAEGTIREESDLMDYLRKTLNAPKLILSIRIDSSLKKEAPVVKSTILSAKDKYLQMREDNPVVEQLRKTFDLRPDE